MNDIEKYARVFDGITPWSGNVPKGFIPDFLGGFTDGRFRAMWGIEPGRVGGGHLTTEMPTIGWGEGWFETVNWVEAAREARDRFTMVTLGACYGAQAVGSYLALKQLNPMPCPLLGMGAAGLLARRRRRRKA